MINCTYQISELTTKQVAELVKKPKYRSFGPTHCDECGCKAGFYRRVFHVADAPTEDSELDDYQNLMRYHMKQQYGFDFVFFRVNGDRHYIETAICPDCNSSKVVFDIELSPGMLAKVFR